MKALLAVILAFMFFLVGWSFLSIILYGIGYVASQARGGVGLIHFLQVFLMWVLGPGFGGFIATYTTPLIFKNVSAKTIEIGFISVITTLAIILGLFSLLMVYKGEDGLGKFIIFLIQFAAIIIGAKIGKSMRTERES